MNIGSTIKQIRQKKGQKQKDFALTCGISQSYLSLIENDVKEPTITLLKRISQELEIPLPILMFYSLEEDDVNENKKEAYGLLESHIKNMINSVFAETELT
ncbi:MAG: helix-turn-helix transcriptional regulator [Flavobacteriia bacterium]|nr:helix-turn-helix transcriptional regulator [Flavobacteriia bacterium]